MGELGIMPGDGFERIEDIEGRDLAGMKYIHPLADEVPMQAELEAEQPKVHTILLSKEYVSEGEGVGMVHTAPGHGPEDFEVGMANGIPIFSPVGIDGHYTEEAGVFEGNLVFDMNDDIIAKLEAKGTLVRKAPIEHEYAHCWRCKSKLIYQATEQWFFNTSSLSDDMRKANDEIYWVPDHSGHVQFDSWLKNLRRLKTVNI